MTDQEINIAIAEACGWHDFHKLGEHGWFGCDPKREGLGRFKIEDYCADLNAMHEAEKVLQGEREWEAYIQNLLKLTRGKGFVVLHAPARQRAEAFVRTIGKWKD